MQKIKQHKSTFAILGVLLLLFFSICISFFVSSVGATTNVTIENSGSRLNAKSDGTPSSYQWLISDTVDGTYSPIDGANQKYYDIKAEDEGKYIKVSGDSSESEAVGPIGKLIVFDLSLGSVNFGATYSGNGGALTGDHIDSNIYVVTQSNTETYSTNTIKFSGTNLQKYDVTIDGIHLGSEPVTGKAPNSQGIGTYTQGVIDLQPSGGVGSKNVILRLKGENIVRAIHYYTNGSASNSSLKITDIKGDGAADGGLLYVPVKVDPDKIEEFVNSDLSYNHWNSGIGGDDGSGDKVTNFEIAGGRLQVLTTYADNCTAIGAGGNGACTMTISGGDITAHCNGTGTAIGGGIGWFSGGGTSNITISGGNIYAKNHGQIYVNGSTITTKDKPYDKVVGGVAIGSGSSFEAAGSEGKVTITGGYIEAYGTFGNGIGGGNSSNSTGGKATISISGGTVIASSIGGGDSKSGTGGSANVEVGGTAHITLEKGVGGGSSLSGNGGAATITVSGGTLYANGSIGGGEGGGTGNGGDATVNIYGGNLTAASIGGGTGSVGGHGGAAIVEVTDGFIETGSIGGGKTNNPNGNLGYAKATISGGDISGQFLMAAGGTEPCTFKMTGGTLHGVDTADTSKFNYAQQNGAVVYMDDPNGVVSISGGTIKDCSAANGGAIYMSDGTCTISGNAVIESCVASEDGGAVYMGGGTLTVTGGSIKNNSAQQNGGAVYLGGGSMTVYSGEISANTSKDSGGAAYIDGGNVKVAGGSITNNTATKDGGGIVVNNGNYKMTGGSVDNNTAVNGAGGGFYVSTDGHNVTVDVLSGSVSNNSAKGNGGAFAVVGNTDSTESIIVNVGVNKNHFDTSGNLITNCEHGDEGDDAYACPVLNGNKSGASGGGIYVTGNTSTQLNIYCLEEKDSQADGDNGQSNFMKVDGGKVTITTSEQPDESNQTSHHGNTHITSEVYVTGGQMDIWGGMTNPRLEDIITVDITKKDDHFKDHRYNQTEDKYYKLIYFENFTDPVTKITTGQYKEIAIKHGDSINISGNIYSHPGYTIKGWNTSNGRDAELDNYPQGEYNNDRGWYNVGDEKCFDGAPIGDLTIYAIWEANGYTVVYDPNIPSGETYYGTMENFNFTYDTPIKLSKNLYERPGYEFVGWSKEKEPDSSAKIYADEEVVTNLTTKKGEIVTLYAQWKVCDHDPATHEYTYSVIDNGKTLKRDCSCGKYSEEARLSAENAVYDKDNHEAKVVYTSSKWNPAVVYEALDGDALVDNKPYYAGSYRASITENGYTASVTYTIEKADQPAPPKPEYDTNTETDGSVISVKPVVQSSVSDETDTPYSEYRVVYYVDGIEKATDWVKGANELIGGQYAAQFALDKALTNYHIQVRYSESDNYKESPVSTADSIYFFVGDVEFKVICGEGVKYVILTSGEDNVTENGIKIAVSVEDGYFFPIEYTAKIIEGPDGLCLVLEDGDPKVYSITEIPNNSKIVLELPDAKKNLVVNSGIDEKQVFTSVTGNAATISRDSAYTVSFTVENYSKDEYEELILHFDSSLPVGTTIILQDKSNGAYYWTEISNENVRELPLSVFVRMGDSEETAFESTNGNMKLQFIIDFSQTNSGIAGDAVTTTLSAEPKTVSKALTGQGGETAELKDVSSYKLNAGTEIGEIVFSHTNSIGAASIWDGRDDALVFKPKSALPADAHLSIKLGEAKIVVYANCDGNFVYSMPDQATGTISVSLVSNLLGEGSETYPFEVDWIVAESKEEYSPMNAGIVAVTEVNIQGVGQSPISLKIVGDKKLYSLNDTVSATVSWDDLPSNHKLEVVLMVKTESGDYSSTAVTKEIVFTQDSGTQTISISLAGNNAGSYRLYLTAELGLATVAAAEYYFIIN